MTKRLELILKTSVLHKKKSLVVDPAFFQYGNVIFPKDQIAEIRYGLVPIKGYRFRIGRIYCIDIKNIDGKVLKIRLKSIYRFNKILLNDKYIKIIKAIFENYMNDISLGYIKNFNDKLDFKLLGNTFNQHGLIFSNTNEIIPWNDLGTKNYSTYYALFSKANPNKYRAFQYLYDWNTSVLYSVSREILKAKKLL